MGIEEKNEGAFNPPIDVLDQGNESLRVKQKTIIDELEYIEDETERFWKTPSSSRMVRGGTMMLIADIISSLFFTVYMMMISRASTEESSLLAVIDTMGIMLRLFAYLGFTSAGSKYLSEYLTRDKETARIYAKSAAKYNMWVTGFPLIMYSIILFLTKPENATESLAYLCLVVIITFSRMTSCVSIYIIGYKRYDLYTIAYYIPYAGSYLAAIITYPLFGVAGPLISFAGAQILIFIFSLIMMKKCSDFPLSDLIDWGKDFGLFWKMFSFNFLYSLANLAFSLLTSTLLITGGDSLGVLTEQEIVAIYTISTFSNILMNLFGVVGPIMVSVSESHALKNKKLVDNYTMIAVKFPIIMTIAVLTFFLLFGSEMIEILYGARWITMGMLIMVCLMPAYTTGSFASKYDNILAGIGRPETVIFPWMLALVIGLVGLIIGRFLPELYLIDDFITSNGETLNYGISLRFAFTLITTSLGLFVGGIWIVKICLRVLNVKIPKGYFLKPILVALITAGLIKLFLLIVPLRSLLDQLLSSWLGNRFDLVLIDSISGISYTVIMVLSGVLLYISFGILFDIMNREDGLFWKNIAMGMGPLYPLMIPLFKYCKFLLKYQIKYFKSTPIQWIITSDKNSLHADSQFTVNVTPLTRGNTFSEKGVELVPGETVQFKISIENTQITLYNIIAYARIDFSQIESSLIYLNNIAAHENAENILEFQIPSNIKTGSHELILYVEAYEQSRNDLTPTQLMKKGKWSYWDFRMRWNHEEEYYIYIPDIE